MSNGLKVCPVCYWNEFIRFKKNTNTIEKLALLKEAIKKIDNDFLINLIESKNGQLIWKELKSRMDN
jgi:CRISPR/Cas system CMR-associated protein Cmr5 small subunit